jgi:ATP synthase protein I
MSPQQHRHSPDGDSDQSLRQVDPWIAFAHLVSGVFLYGLIGWLVDQWLNTSFVVGIGIVLGAALGTYLTLKRFSQGQSPASTDEVGQRLDEDQSKERTQESL